MKILTVKVAVLIGEILVLVKPVNQFEFPSVRLRGNKHLYATLLRRATSLLRVMAAGRAAGLVEPAQLCRAQTGHRLRYL